MATLVVTPTFPRRTNTVTAEVLARLLRGETLTSLDTVFNSSTTRLGAFIFTLSSDYRWEIESEPFAAACKDGRVAWPHKYYLRREVIAAAGPGAGRWCSMVFKDRRERAKKAVEAVREARRINAARSARRPHPGQQGLFD